MPGGGSNSLLQHFDQGWLKIGIFRVSFSFLHFTNKPTLSPTFHPPSCFTGACLLGCPSQCPKFHKMKSQAVLPLATPTLSSVRVLLQPPYLDLDVHLLFIPAFSPSEHIEPVPSFPLYLAPCPAATPHPQSSLLHLASSSYCNNFLADLPDSSLSPSIQLVQVARLIFPNTAFIKSLANSSTPTAFCIHSKCLHLALRASHLLPSFFQPFSLPHFINPIS